MTWGNSEICVGSLSQTRGAAASALLAAALPSLASASARNFLE